MGTFANSEDPDEMPLYVAFHPGLQCLLSQNGSSEKEIFLFYNPGPLNTYSGLSRFYCINFYGKVHWSTKG